MEKFYIIGGNKLNGKIKISTSKNATLPILASAVLTDEEVIIKQIPNLADVNVFLQLLADIGVKVKKQNNAVVINASFVNKTELNSELTNKLRASIFLLGPMLAKYKKIKMAYPGGCNIGTRPIDLHLNGLRSMGAKIITQHGYIFASCKSLKGANITLDFASVGATENLIMAGTLASGTTTITNCAKEPEIVDLANFINKMGGKIKGAGTSVVTIEGVKKLKGVTYSPIKDRIVAGTYLLAGLIAGGKIELIGVNGQHINALLNKIKNIGCELVIKNDRIILSSNKPLKSIPLIETGVYPGFATDLQAPIMALQAFSSGVSIIKENIFENRFKQVYQLIKMGAKIVVKNNTAIVTGQKTLYGAEVIASDLRAGASLVLAGLNAKGYTKINNIHHIDRGYENLENSFKKLGANIKRIKE